MCKKSTLQASVILLLVRPSTYRSEEMPSGQLKATSSTSELINFAESPARSSRAASSACRFLDGGGAGGGSDGENHRGEMSMTCFSNDRKSSPVKTSTSNNDDGRSTASCRHELKVGQVNAAFTPEFVDVDERSDVTEVATSVNVVDVRTGDTVGAKPDNVVDELLGDTDVITPFRSFVERLDDRDVQTPVDNNDIPIQSAPASCIDDSTPASGIDNSTPASGTNNSTSASGTDNSTPASADDDAIAAEFDRIIQEDVNFER